MQKSNNKSTFRLMFMQKGAKGMAEILLPAFVENPEKVVEKVYSYLNEDEFRRDIALELCKLFLASLFPTGYPSDEDLDLAYRAYWMKWGNKLKEEMIPEEEVVDEQK